MTGAVAAAVALLVVLPGAGAHLGNAKLYRSVVTSIEPADLPIEAKVLGGDDQLSIVNLGDRTLTVYGYKADPATDTYDAVNAYLQITPDGVRINHKSVAWFTNSQRVPGPVPKDAGKVAPQYKLATEVSRYSWHDHRIHWMSSKPPANVDTGDSARQKVFDWKVPVQYGDTRGYVHGRLYYIGGGTNSLGVTGWITIAAIIAMLVVFVVDWRRRRRRSAGAPATDGDDAAAA